jgi:hypothetical protein
MKIVDRLSYALIGFIFGAVLAAIGWWLYGLAFSLRYYGSGIDPSLRHWVIYVGGAFAVLGFIFREGVGDAVGNVLHAIFDFEEGSSSGRGMSFAGSLILLALIGAAIWFTLK